MSKDKGLSAIEAARRLGVRLDSLYALLWAGKIEAHKLDGRWLVSSSAVEARLKARERTDGTAGR